MHSHPRLGGVPCVAGWPACPQDFLSRVQLDMEGMARSIPPSVCMLCLHGTADKTIPHQVRARCQPARCMCSTVQCSAVQCSTVQYRSTWHGHIRLLLFRRHAMPGIPTCLLPPCCPQHPQESELCASLVPNSQLVLVEGADHNFTRSGAQLAQHVVDFVLSA